MWTLQNIIVSTVLRTEQEDMLVKLGVKLLSLKHFVID